jgi:hypothetical protein
VAGVPGNGLPDRAGAAFFDERGRGTYVDALAALNADRVVHVGLIRRRDDRVETSAVLAQVIDALDFGANPDASAAEYAFFAVADHGMARKFDWKPLPLAFKMSCPDA